MPPLLLLALAAGACTVGGLLLAGLPVAWILLLVCALATIPVVVWFVQQNRFFEPLPILAASCTLIFVLRPLQLMLGWRDLYSYISLPDPVEDLVYLEGQEMARYVATELDESLQAALTRGVGACALFLVLLLVGYKIAAGGRAAKRLSTLRSRGAAPFNVTRAIAISLIIGVAAQVAIVIRAGGPGATIEDASKQTALQDSLILHFLSGFTVAGVIIDGLAAAEDAGRVVALPPQPGGDRRVLDHHRLPIAPGHRTRGDGDHHQLPVAAVAQARAGDGCDRAVGLCQRRRRLSGRRGHRTGRGGRGEGRVVTCWTRA